jgi:hypothetical protein
MFVIAYTDQTGPRYFKRIAQVMGQPSVAATRALDDARIFKTRAAAEKLHAKWKGAGVGMACYAVCEIKPNEKS